jgi:translocation and assembly module TamB
MSLSSITGRAGVEIDDGPTLRDVAVEAHAGAHDVRIRAKLLRIVGDEVRVEDAMIHGFGAPIEATVRMSPGQLHVRARSEDVDLARVARFTRVSLVREGRVSLDVDASVGAGVAEGRVAIDVSHAAFASFKDATAHVQATLHGREAAGTVTASVPEIGSIEVQSSSVQVGASGLLSMSSWRRAWGALDIKAIVDLPKLAARLPPGMLPFRPLGGQLQFAGRIERDSMSDSTPAVDCTASTTGLVLAGGSGAAAWYVDGLNPTVHVGVDGQTGDTSVGINVRDSAGVYFEADATSSAVPYASIFSGEETIESLRTAPFDATVTVPSRSLQSLPAAWGLGGVPGLLQAEVTWHGAAASPAIHVSGSLKRGGADSAASALPVDLAFAADYDGARASATLQATNKEKVVLDVSAAAELRAADLLGGLAGASVPWKGSARAKLDALPLRSIAFLSDRQVRGRISGQFTLDGLHEDARASATATIEGLTIGDVACKTARFQAVVDGRAFDASARVEHEGGYVDARVHTGIKWGPALAPEIDSTLPADGALSAKQFRAALLLPFVSGLFAGLDGLIDADAHVAVDPGTRVARPEGTIKLTKGEFELTSLGGEFTDTSATVTLTPDGLIRVENAVAHGISGRIEAAASARMVGFVFSGARATVQVPKTEPIPVVFDGVEVGKMEGRFDIQASRAPDHKELDVKVDVPRLHMELPLSASHDVQALGDLEGVTTGVVRGSNDFVEVPLDAAVSAPSGGPPPSPIKIAVRLGADVEVTRGEDLDVRLEGQPIITIANEVTVTGQIRLLRGTLDIYGKPFEVEKGTVSFVGPDPGNPQVVLTAGWTAQDGTHVYADFVGPLKTGKVTLRSEPVSSQNEILALILSGTADTSAAATSQQAQMSTVAGAAGGAATQPINRALGGVNRALENLGLAGGISTKIDTSQTNPRPEVELQIARDISLQIAWVLGTPVPGSNPDTTLVTLNWSFLRKWSLETTVGDAGTSILDLIWQHRY